MRESADYEAFSDAPWSGFDLYKKFDKIYPGSKFILLERNMEDWIRSHENYFSDEKLKRGFPVISGYEGKKKGIVDDHLRVYEEIKQYFSGRDGTLLVMNICNGDGWEQLCPFLGLEIPDSTFPHINRIRAQGDKRT